jgi:hypothetical protein
MEGLTGFRSLINEIHGLDDKAYLMKALFALEQVWLIPDGTWGEWKAKFDEEARAAESQREANRAAAYERAAKCAHKTPAA